MELTCNAGRGRSGRSSWDRIRAAVVLSAAMSPMLHFLLLVPRFGGKNDALDPLTSLPWPEIKAALLVLEETLPSTRLSMVFLEGASPL